MLYDLNFVSVSHLTSACYVDCHHRNCIRCRMEKYKASIYVTVAVSAHVVIVSAQTLERGC